MNIVKYWANRIERAENLYPTLVHLNKTYTPGKFHPVLQTGCSSPLEATRLPARLRLPTGTYVLQVNRSKFNQNKIDPLCQLCKQEEETNKHFLLHCEMLSSVRNPILNDIVKVIEDHKIVSINNDEDILVQVILDCSMLNCDIVKYSCADQLEFHIRRLLYQLHTMRYRLFKNLS